MLNQPVANLHRRRAFIVPPIVGTVTVPPTIGIASEPLPSRAPAYADARGGGDNCRAASGLAGLVARFQAVFRGWDLSNTGGERPRT
jgi:hypothetical protein